MKKSQIMAAAENANWTCNNIWKQGKDYVAEFETYTDFGQDVIVTVFADKIENFGRSIQDYYEDYDPSEEASLWLDDTGHGKNGAPYEMIDVYNDMKEAEGLILDLSKAVCKTCGYAWLPY